LWLPDTLLDFQEMFAFLIEKEQLQWLQPSLTLNTDTMYGATAAILLHQEGKSKIITEELVPVLSLQ
jgi:hypothetical protein